MKGISPQNVLVPIYLKWWYLPEMVVLQSWCKSGKILQFKTEKISNIEAIYAQFEYFDSFGKACFCISKACTS